MGVGLRGRAESAPMDESDRQALQKAKAILENPGLAARLVNLLGTPIEKGLKLLPGRVQSEITGLTNKALLASLRVALSTVGNSPGWQSSNLTNKIGAMATGGAGGFFGIAGLAVELPVSTTIMMRAIATIAREHGEDISSPASQMACLEVFALGGPSTSDDGTETGYYMVRGAMARAVAEAVTYLGKGGAAIAGKEAPALVKLIVRVAERFSVQVTEKAVAQAVPIIGAVGAASINLIFIDHFQDMAGGHFTVRRLERKYDPATVRAIYDSLPSRLA